MNRKLQHTVQAFTATAAVFGLLLLAGNPASPGSPPGAVAGIATGAASAQPVERDAVQAKAPVAGDHVRRNHRATLAMPYFSFGRGAVRRATGS